MSADGFSSLNGDAGILGMPRSLADLADGRLKPDEVDAVLSWLEASADDEPPSWVVNRAVRISRQEEAGRRARPTLWRRLEAALVYDNRLQPRIAGARSVALEQPRLMYQAGGVEIDLEVANSITSGRSRVLGHVSAAAPDLERAWVVAHGPLGRAEAEVDDLGQFVLDDLTTGPHRLEIGLAYELIEISDVQI